MADQNTIGQGIVKIIADLTGLKTGLAQAKTETTGAMTEIGGKIGTAMNIAAAATIATIAVMTKLVMTATETGEKFHIFSQETGMSTEELSRFAYAALTAGLGVENVAQSVGFLSKQMVATAQSADPASTALGRLGITVKDANGHMRSTHDVLIDIADKFKSLPNGAEKTALALQLFGRSGKQLIPLLNEGGQAIAELETKADELGITVGKDFAENAHEFNDQMALMKERVHNAGRSLAEDMLPALNNVMHSLAGDFAQGVHRDNEELGAMSTLMRGLSGSYNDFATAAEKAGKPANYMRFVFAAWARDLDGVKAGLKYVGDTLATIAGTVPAFLGSTHSADYYNAKTPAQSNAALAKEAMQSPDEGLKRGWEGVKNWWQGWWTDMKRINDEGGRALEDLEKRYFGKEEDDAAAHQAAMDKIKSEAAAKADKSMQVDVIRMKEQLAQLDLQNLTAKLDAGGLREKDKLPQLKAARANVTIYADGLAEVTRQEQLAQGANKDLADAVYIYTKRILLATFANDEQGRSIAQKKKLEEQEIEVMRQKSATLIEQLKATKDGAALEYAQIQEQARLDSEIAKKKIKNAQDISAKLLAIELERKTKTETLEKRERDDIDKLNRQSMDAVLQLTMHGYEVEKQLIDDDFKQQEDDARRTIAIKEHLDARLIQLELEKAAKIKALQDQYTSDLARAIEVVGEEWLSKGPGLLDIVRGIFTQMHDTVSRVFFDAITNNLHDLSDAFKSLFKSILKNITDMLADEVIKQLMAWLLKLIHQIMAARAAASANAALDMSELLFGFANGGIVPGGFRKFSVGGVVDRPTLGLVGEGSMNEAVVPLPDGRNIPVRMAGGSRPLDVHIALSWTSELLQAFKSSPDEISLIINREVMSNGGLRQTIRTRG